jgi:purine catabolism regulator
MPQALRESYLRAVSALRTSRLKRGVVGKAQGASYESLLDACPRPILESFVSSVLGELSLDDEKLLASVRAFLDAGGRWESAARSLGVHRHTLRYRVRRAEELMGRDLSDAEDRLEVAMVLRAVDVSGPLAQGFPDMMSR